MVGIALVLPIENALSASAASGRRCFRYEELIVVAMLFVVFLFACVGALCSRDMQPRPSRDPAETPAGRPSAASSRCLTAAPAETPPPVRSPRRPLWPCLPRHRGLHRRLLGAAVPLLFRHAAAQRRRRRRRPVHLPAAARARDADARGRDCSREAAEGQPRGSRGVAEGQPRCSREAAGRQPGGSREAAERERQPRGSRESAEVCPEKGAAREAGEAAVSPPCCRRHAAPPPPSPPPPPSAPPSCSAAPS